MLNSNLNFSNRTALVTGATRGIGKSIALNLGRHGARLILTGKDNSNIDSAREAMFEQGCHDVKFIPVDFSSDISLQGFFEKITQIESIDICINNAGINIIDCIDETSMDNFNRIMDVNLKAPFLICRTVSAKMKQAKWGRIVNIASIWSVITKSKRSAYTTTKAGLAGLTRTLAVELAPFNILVNTVSPGFTLTELTRSTLTKAEIKDLSCQVPLKRFACPDEIANLVMFLCSDMNTYLTGQNIVIDGGFTIV